MLFSSITFVFMFLPIVCVTYLLSPKKLNNLVLLVASIIFYAWSDCRYLTIMILIIFTNYLGALFISKVQEQSQKKLILFITLFINLDVLFYFKYLDFAVENIAYLMGIRSNIVYSLMPIGISFYTFQAISYVIDVYRKEVKVQKNICKLALYISFFPQLVAGPIIKYHDVDKQITHRKADFNKVIYGIKRFIIGLAKKILIANTLGVVADKIFEQPVEQLDTITSWIGAIAYSLQLFYDFSGYSDMAIGLGSIFGFKFLENFNYPYISKSITEFWRRWHISLSTWFKEYLYIPLGGNRVSQSRNLLNLFIVFLTTGLWHGASWNFIFWGLWHGFFIILEKLTGWHKKEGSWKISLAQHTYTIFIFIFGWVMFRAKTMTYACQYIKKMLGLTPENNILYEISYYIGTQEILTFLIAVLCSIPIFKKILEVKTEQKILYTIINIWLLILFILSSALMAASTYNPFIYFRF